ncbi:Heterokaryon incompatibility domain-containing protein [Madurella fahalii]|uniref:Heterokaryon incompatibility domain-containing protein n=1 Tax=Madurella fahalii TaxID=1157608 RepID=A0ABQ0G4M3_9PEZI
MEALESQQGYLHSEDLESVVRTADHCALCKLILRQMCAAIRFHVQSDVEITDAREAAELFASFITEKHQMFMVVPTPVILRLDNSRQSPGADYVAIGTKLVALLEGEVEFKLGLFWGRLLLHDNKDSVAPLKPRGTDDEVLGRLADWLRARRSEVPSWSDAGDDKPLPRRVLDLSCFGDAQPGPNAADIRLFEPAAGQCGQYVALSYCWGGYTECRTLKANLAERLDRIQFGLLPEVYKHAVRVTRGLGIRYLWIDALCIIQDDEADWVREAATMCDVYWNTVCRLAVTDSKRPTEGFFPPAPIAASVRVPSLEAVAQKRWYDENCTSDLGATADGGEQGEESEGGGVNVVSASLKPTCQIRDEACEEMSFNQDMTSNNTKQRTPLNLNVFVDDGDTLERISPSQPPPDARDICAADSDEGVTPLDSLAERGEDEPLNMILDGLMARFDDMMQEEDSQVQAKKPQDDVPLEMYITLPRAYTVDVDRGHLNSRGWVLQERLLAPRTIHFTKHHIYCEDQDDLCGEDWIRRYFTWRSAIDKASEFTPIELFPERRFNSVENFGQNVHGGDIWWQRGTYRKSDNHVVTDPWLRICEIYSRCKLSYDTDKLAAMAGLVKKKQQLTHSGNTNNFLGLWEESLHVELAWVANKVAKLKFLRSLNLPSWAWMAHEGAIRFTKEDRNFRDPYRVRLSPVDEVHLVEADVPDMTTPLPLAEAASLTVDVTIRKLDQVSTETIESGEYGKTREEMAVSTPFHFDPRTQTIPILLPEQSECQEILDSDQKVIGFLSFDEDTGPTGDMFCAHISTLLDEAHFDAMRAFDNSEVQSVDVRQFRTPILAYALVLVKVAGTENEYKRAGLAQVNYDWMVNGTKERVRLV